MSNVGGLSIHEVGGLSIHEVGGLSIHEVGGLSIHEVGGLSIHEVGGGYYIHSEYIRYSLLVFNTLFMTTSNFGGAQPPLIKKWGGLQPPLPPQVLCL